MNNLKTILVVTLVVLFHSLTTSSVNAQTLKQANNLYEQFAYYEAINVYKAVWNKDKNNPEIAEKLGDCYRNTSETRKAEYWYNKAVRLNPSKPELVFYYAQALMSNKKYTQALPHFENYHQMMPNDSRGLLFIESCQHINELLRDSSMYQIANMRINSRSSDFGAAFLNEGLVFASGRVSGSMAQKSGWTGEAYTEMYYTEQENNRWTTPKNLPGKKATQFHEGPATFNHAGTVMYFTRNVGKGKKGKTVNLKIYEARWHSGNKAWQEERPVSFNSDHYSVGHPALSADGKRLYFTSDSPGGFGGKDIYVSEKKGGHWSSPRNLGPSVNTEGDEMFPTTHEDGSVYFASNGRGGFGGLDIFSAVLDGKTTWRVSNVGYPINSARDDFNLLLGTDKQTGYLSSNRTGGRGKDDIYSISIMQKKAKEMLVLTSNLYVAPAKSTSFSSNTEAFDYRASTNKKEVTDVTPTYSSRKNAREVKLVLIGIVLDNITKAPMDRTKVTLQNDRTGEITDFETIADGNFFFKLMPNHKYTLMNMDANGNIQDRKAISTVNVEETEILHAILEIQSNNFNASGDFNNTTAPTYTYQTVDSEEDYASIAPATP
ncbi:MAG: hypothetical protein ACPGXL_00755, partial [Chitinophagales bacterium]